MAFHLKYYSDIPQWENQRRLNKLYEFREKFLTYFENSHVERMAQEPTENEAALNARTDVNKNLDEAHDIILSSGINPVITYKPPPMVGGPIHDIDVIMNIFQIHRFQLQPDIPLDFIERAIGIYENDASRALIRTLNPFFYLGILFDWIAALPFKLLGRLGFDQGNAESSPIGRITKGSIYIISALASLLTVMQLLGMLDDFKQLAKTIFAI